MLLRKEEEEVHGEEGALKACNDSGAGADGVDSCEIDATLKRSGNGESLPGNYGENVCN